MGNSAPKPKPISKPKPRSPFHLHGSASCPLSTRIRISLLIKSVPFSFTHKPNLIHKPFLKFGSQTIRSGAVLKFLESKFAGTKNAAEAEAIITLQHRSIKRHVDGLERWVQEELAGKVLIGGKGRVRAREWYGRLVEMMQEHARMEEMFLFPSFEIVCGSDVCRKAIENHGRDLPMMNGINEDIKMLCSVDARTPFYQEALSNLRIRLKKFQNQCKEHFEEEEKKLSPLLKDVEIARREGENKPWSQIVWANTIMKLMENTHSNQFFPFLIAGLSSNEAMQYLDIVCRCINDDSKLLSLFHSIISWFEGTMPLSWMKHTPYLKH